MLGTQLGSSVRVVHVLAAGPALQSDAFVFCNFREKSLITLFLRRKTCMGSVPTSWQVTSCTPPLPVRILSCLGS